MKHTPGPWQTNLMYSTVRTADDSLEICEIALNENNETFNFEQYKGNARLIAAAPELLDALERMLLWANIGDESPSRILRDEVKSVISKAKGQ